MTEGNRLAYFFAFLLAVLTNRGIRTVGLTNCTFSLISLDLLSLLAPETTVQPKWKAESRKLPLLYTMKAGNKARSFYDYLPCFRDAHRQLEPRLDQAKKRVSVRPLD